MSEISYSHSYSNCEMIRKQSTKPGMAFNPSIQMSVSSTPVGVALPTQGQWQGKVSMDNSILAPGARPTRRGVGAVQCFPPRSKR